MELMIEKIAELLEVSVKEATRLYPILRTQFLWHRVTSILENFVVVIFCMTGIFMMAAGFIYWMMSDEIFESEVRMRKQIKAWVPHGFKILAITGVIYILLMGLQVFLAPDILFLKGMLQ